MITLQEYISEAIDELYHFTNIPNLVNICKQDKFRCSEDDGYNYDYKYFISMSRQKNSLTGYPTGMIDNKISRIVLDGRKLNSNFKVGPVDTLHGKGRAIKNNWGNKEDFEKYKDSIMLQTSVENEDRLFSNREYIENFHKYIKEIQLDIITLTDSETKIIEEYGRKYNIPITLFTPKQFKIGRR